MLVKWAPTLSFIVSDGTANSGLLNVPGPSSTVQLPAVSTAGIFLKTEKVQRQGRGNLARHLRLIVKEWGDVDATVQ